MVKKWANLSERTFLNGPHVRYWEVSVLLLPYHVHVSSKIDPGDYINKMHVLFTRLDMCCLPESDSINPMATCSFSFPFLSLISIHFQSNGDTQARRVIFSF